MADRMRIVNGWAQFDDWYESLCGAQHLWRIFEDGMPCNCGAMRLVKGRMLPVPPPDAPNIAYRFGTMSHFYPGECGCHPPQSAAGEDASPETASEDTARGR